ncbi:2,3-dihydroxy-2,3-dihydro-p-cumate dehydrogenase [Neobacillus niacini]|uniref:SDR family NAD(P)-dependent oxidoreductase n=1 Tax=Neobacillus niacini TaxID=86668 RepID=UPI00277F4D9E|nr:SDR family oxidoreductase [Neobacillus niacini]MDQ1002213.1 2,3-dihydroxy-2,3-dihydro-p-cumate dehydrogenase [Neobacillus niacini]
MNNNQLLAGKVAVVTGAAKGIGFELALDLAKNGANILIADVLETEAKLACEKLTEATNCQSTYYIGDLSIEEHNIQMISKALDTWGKVDILVNNAGGGVILPFLEQTPETLKQTIDRNLWTTLWACRTVLPHMIERKFGKIINIGADSVRNGLHNHAAYNAAKGGVHALTTGLAREFAGYNITVNTVAPCMVATERVKEKMKAPNQDMEEFLKVIPLGRPAEMSEVASMVSYLASDNASFITGQVISVNGGSTML